MEGEGAKGGKKNERLCLREERKRRKTTTGLVEEGPRGQHRHSDHSSVHGVVHGIHLCTCFKSMASKEWPQKCHVI